MMKKITAAFLMAYIKILAENLKSNITIFQKFYPDKQELQREQVAAQKCLDDLTKQILSHCEMFLGISDNDIPIVEYIFLTEDIELFNSMTDDHKEEYFKYLLGWHNEIDSYFVAQASGQSIEWILGQLEYDKVIKTGVRDGVAYFAMK